MGCMRKRLNCCIPGLWPLARFLDWYTSLVCSDLLYCSYKNNKSPLLTFLPTLPGFFFGYAYLNPEAKPIDAGITGVLLNVILAVLIDVFFMDRTKLNFMFRKTKKEKTDDEEVASPSLAVQRPDWDIPCGKRFGESKLTDTLLNEAMDGFPGFLTSSCLCRCHSSLLLLQKVSQ